MTNATQLHSLAVRNAIQNGERTHVMNSTLLSLRFPPVVQIHEVANPVMQLANELHLASTSISKHHQYQSGCWVVYRHGQLPGKLGVTPEDDARTDSRGLTHQRFQKP